METYLFKLILCSSVLIGFYYLILERQKAHGFKRFYLLSGIVFSILIPFMSITYGVVKEVSAELVVVNEQGQISTSVSVENTIFTFENIIYVLYFLVTAILLMRFLISLNALRREIISGKKIKRGQWTLVLKEEKATPHSFWKFIFLNRKDFEEGRIDEKIIRHEETHLEQKHSLDVLLIEFLLTIFWFNPAFYLYKKAMLTNHEFLADESVLRSETDIKDYQKLLLTELISEKILFTNQFNLRNTKKRIDMMTKKPTLKSKLYSWLTLPLAVVLFFAFVKKVPAKSEINTSVKDAVPAIIKNAGKQTLTVPSPDADTIRKPTLEDMRKKETELENAKANAAAAAKIGDMKKAELQKLREEIPPPPPPVEDRKSQLSQDVDKLPVFPGGLNSMRSKVADLFDTSKMNKEEGIMKTEIYFVIDKNGIAKKFEAKGSNEIFNNSAKLAIEKANENAIWEPAEKDGKKVDYVFKLPLTMSFENFDNIK